MWAGLAACITASLLAAGCGSNAAPSPSPSRDAAGSNSQATAQADQASAAPVTKAAATSPQYTLSGPAPFTCVKAGTAAMQWLLDVTDAGPRHVRFVANTHQDGAAGCGATVKNPRPRVTTSGISSYSPHQSGQTTFAFDPRAYGCGRVQVDVSMFDDAGNETLLIAAVIDYGTTCDPQLSCSPASQSVGLNATATATASGGIGSYTWSAPGGTTTAGSGTSFSTSYAASGVHTVTVSSGSQTASCQVQVAVPLTCSPATQTVNVGDPVTLTAVGGSGSYNWLAFAASVTSGSGSSFTTSYAVSGSKVIILADGSTTTSCQAVVN